MFLMGNIADICLLLFLSLCLQVINISIFSAFPYSCPHTNSITGQLETLQSYKSDSILSCLITSVCRVYVQNPSCTDGNDWAQMELPYAWG